MILCIALVQDVRGHVWRAKLVVLVREDLVHVFLFQRGARRLFRRRRSGGSRCEEVVLLSGGVEGAETKVSAVELELDRESRRRSGVSSWSRRGGKLLNHDERMARRDHDIECNRIIE